MITKSSLRDFDSLFELLKYFDSEEKCEDYLAKLLWNGNPECTHCGHDKVYVLNVKGRGRRYKCPACHYQGTVRSGTIFSGSKISLKKWFIAIYLITAHKKGISSHQLAKDIEVTQKTAWFMSQRIREAFVQENVVFDKPVEIDETFVGGREANKHANKKIKKTEGRSTKGKIPVLGIIERESGKVYAIPVVNTRGYIILPIIRQKIIPGTKIFTDDYNAYTRLKKDYIHESVNHSAYQYVNGEAHTNSIESFWALFKRGIIGIYHHTSNKHLGRYVNEFTFRFNHRHLTEGSRFDVFLLNAGKRLSYKELTGK